MTVQDYLREVQSVLGRAEDDLSLDECEELMEEVSSDVDGRLAGYKDDRKREDS